MSIGKIKRRGLPFSNVVASGVATAQIESGRTIERLTLALGGTAFTKAMITGLKIKANAKAVIDLSGTQLDKAMKFRAIADDAAFLTLDFTELKGRDRGDQFVGGFDTSGIKALSIEVTIAGATAPTLSYSVVESAPQVTNPRLQRIAPMLHKMLRYPFSVAAGGALPIPLPFGETGAIIKRLHIETSAGQVDSVIVKEDSRIVYEGDKADIDFYNSEHGRVNQANWLSLDFVADNNQSNAFDVRKSRSLELTPTFSAACTGFVIAEYYDTLGNL